MVDLVNNLNILLLINIGSNMKDSATKSSTSQTKGKMLAGITCNDKMMGTEK